MRALAAAARSATLAWIPVSSPALPAAALAARAAAASLQHGSMHGIMAAGAVGGVVWRGRELEDWAYNCEVAG